MSLNHPRTDAPDLPQLAVPCPDPPHGCGAHVGDLCTSHNGTRPRHHSTHRARTAAWETAGRPDDTTDRAALRDRIAETLALRENGPASDGRGWFRDEEQRQSFLAAADAVLAVLPTHAAEIARLRKEHATWRKLGQRNLERAHEENARLRAEQAATLERIREVVRRLAAHAVGFQDVLDDSDRGPWGKTVAADIAELRRMAAAARPDDTSTEVGPVEPASPRCAVCNHPKRDHSDRPDQAPSTVVPRRPWCHACDATCDYADPSARPDDTTGATP